jgi:diguanylate cyclase (GGDEF)-like protein
VQGIVLTLRDVSERTALEQQLVHQAFHDPLTRLANRALFRERVEHALRRAHRHHVAPAVLFLDLDNFKTINDSQGHAAGDAVLLAVAARLRSCLRPDDTAARLGGDEFAVLLEDTVNQDDPVVVAERIIAVLRDPIDVEGRQVQSNASVGIAISRCSEENVDELLRNADVAMYMAKNGGKGRYAVFDPAVHAAMLRRLELEADLKRAVAEQEFVLHYQPIVDLHSGALVSMEALVRWVHPERGMVPPGEFIPLAEETGAIVEIGRWVLRAACRQAQEWHERYPVTPARRIAVNLSGLHLQQPTVVDDVMAALEESGLDPHCLTVEITESSMMQDTAATIAKLQAFKALGVALAIDDFGTGYSSLSYLQQFPIDLLKIDRAFVSGVGQGVVDSALARAVVSLGSALGVQTVAEGIEEEGQVRELRELGCERGQGFYFSRPQDQAAITALLERAQRGDWTGAPDQTEAA